MITHDADFYQIRWKFVVRVELKNKSRYKRKLPFESMALIYIYCPLVFASYGLFVVAKWKYAEIIDAPPSSASNKIIQPPCVCSTSTIDRTIKLVYSHGNWPKLLVCCHFQIYFTTKAKSPLDQMAIHSMDLIKSCETDLESERKKNRIGLSPC